MSYDEVTRVDYDDELWTLRELHSALADLLAAKDRLIVIRNGEPPFRRIPDLNVENWLS